MINEYKSILYEFVSSNKYYNKVRINLTIKIFSTKSDQYSKSEDSTTPKQKNLNTYNVYKQV